jgi:hypothetical protein
MANVKYMAGLVGLAALVMAGNALPAQAEVEVLEVLESEAVVELLTPDELITLESVISEVETAELMTADTATSASLLVEAPTYTTFQFSEDNLLAFDQAGIQSALVPAETEALPAATEGLQLAQTRAAYGTVSPAYLGVGGNIGFGDPDSAIGDFGVAVISKISLGPRFSLRPAFFISERFTNFAIPLTYNFNTLSMQGFRFQPYVGAGVDVPFNGNTALMLNAGADVPISRDFTLNTSANFRVTSGFGFGVSVGVGYNFPFIFE